MEKIKITDYYFHKNLKLLVVQITVGRETKIGYLYWYRYKVSPNIYEMVEKAIKQNKIILEVLDYVFRDYIFSIHFFDNFENNIKSKLFPYSTYLKQARRR